jgi:2,4-dienoyl-CoA reductase-like NADH-dependent reductase (Old Yellow Enzyme family)
MPAKPFEPCKIGKLEVKNRFVRSATRDAMADPSGAVTDASVVLYRNLARGGIGLIITGHAFISAHGQAVPGQYGVHNNEMIAGLRRLAEAAHAEGAAIALQISHAGINSDFFRENNTESLAVSVKEDMPQPHRELTGEEIEFIIADFATAAVRAREAGYDAIQFHGAHGYLMSQFQSPLFNRRTDRWGGSAENRRRFHLEVIKRVRQAVGGDFPLLIKYGARDGDEKGLSLEEGVETARLMAQEGIDAIEISLGMGALTQLAKEEQKDQTYFRDWTASVKRAASVPVMAVGGIRSLELSSDLLTSGDADFISMCRPFIREPDLLVRWQRGETQPALCISCNKCHAIIRKGKPLACAQELSKSRGGEAD